MKNTAMRKLTALLLLLALAAACTACGSVLAQTTAEAAPTAAAEPAPAETPAPAPEPEEASSAPEESAAPAEPESTVLVVYFSGTGTTRRIAERLAALSGSDLAEIVPAQPYTAEDLNYNDRTTRATVEQNTPDARPEIANEISLEGYTTVYLGYPIWWGQAPRILSSFVESHDFTGMTVIPFCTSSSSGAGRTGEKLGEQAGSGTFLASTRFDADVSDAELQAWLESRA